MTSTETPPAPPPTTERDEAARESRQALFRLMLVLAAGVVAASALGIARATAVIGAVILMIMLHELGHFLTAKWAGMKVTEFFLGFGPRLWSVRKGETEYGVKALPLGGYVKIIGMHNLDPVDPSDEDRTYRAKPFWRRLSVVLAGSFMHFLIAFVLLWVLLSFIGVVRYDRGPTLEVGALSELTTGASPAQQAGFQLGDRIVSVDGRPVQEWDDIPPYIRARPGEEITFVVERSGERLTLRPRTVDLSQVELEGVGAPDIDEPTGFVGIGPAYPMEQTDALRGVPKAATELGRVTEITVSSLGQIFSRSGIESYGRQLTDGPGRVAPSEDEPRFLSPVGLARIASEVADNGLRDVLFLLVAINVFVGIFNMIPLLPLDGGHVAIAVYEKLRSRRGKRYYVDVAKLMPVTYMVLMLLAFLAVTALYLDIVRPLDL